MLFGLSPTFLGIVSLVAQGVGTMMQVQAQKQALAYQQMQARLQEKQYLQQAEAAELQARAEEEKRRDEFFSNLATNRALMAESGIAMDSPSYRAFLDKNYQTYVQDLQTIRLTGLESKLSSLYDAKRARLTQKTNQISYRTGVATTIASGLLGAVDTGRELLKEK